MRAKSIAIIPARCGSKGVRDKNIAEVGGKTLLEWAIHVGLSCPHISDVFVSTDSPIYEDIALSAGAKSLGLRDASLSHDDTKTIDVVVSLLSKIAPIPEIVVLLQPTSPIRSAADISKMYSILSSDPETDAVVSVMAVDEPHPYKMKAIDRKGYLHSFIKGASSEIPRQRLPEVFKLTGSLYTIRTATLFKEKTFLPRKTKPYIVDGVCLNIDTRFDLILLRELVRSGEVKLGAASV